MSSYDPSKRYVEFVERSLDEGGRLFVVSRNGLRTTMPVIEKGRVGLGDYDSGCSPRSVVTTERVRSQRAKR
jgi:hypothetical protein